MKVLLRRAFVDSVAALTTVNRVTGRRLRRNFSRSGQPLLHVSLAILALLVFDGAYGLSGQERVIRAGLFGARLDCFRLNAGQIELGCHAYSLNEFEAVILWQARVVGQFVHAAQRSVPCETLFMNLGRERYNGVAMKQYSDIAADIVAFDRNGQLALIVEVKNKPGTSREWAASMRRNMYAHGLLPRAPFFLLALPDQFYLWENVGMSNEALEPTLQIDPTPFLGPYYERGGVSPKDVTGKSFELIIAAWLNQILSTESREDLQVRNQQWVVSSGLFDSLAGGRLELEAAA